MFAFVLLLLNCSGSPPPKSPSPITELSSGWQYRLGDSPADSSGRFIWLEDSLNSKDWTSVTHLNDIHPDNQVKAIWLRIELPSWHGPSPAIYTNGDGQLMQIYLDDELIDQHGNFTSIDNDHFLGWHQHLIPLPEHCSNKILTFRIWSNGDYSRLQPPVQFGSMDNILKSLFKADLNKLILGVLFILLALVLVLLFLFFEKNTLFLKVAFYITAIGMLILSNSLLIKTLINAPLLFFYIDTISLLAIPIGEYLIIENIIITKYKQVMRRFWQIHLLNLLVFIVLLTLPGREAINVFFDLFFILSSTLTIVTAVIIIKCRKQVGYEIKLLLAGFIILYLFMGLELGLYFASVKSGEFFVLNWFHWGALFFVASLVGIIIYRYSTLNKQKLAAQKEVMDSALQRERLKSEMTRQQLEADKWQELDQMKSRFLANISHEFRTPLTLILGTARQLIDEHHNEAVTERSRMQEKQGKRLLNQVNQLLDLSKLDAGKMRLQAGENDFIPFSKGIFHAFDSFAAQHDIEMTFHTDVQTINLFFDHHKMETIVSNLISNAMKFTPPGGKVDLTISVDEWLELRVRDTGPGIPPKHLPHLFDRFYQADNQNSVDQGTGIGLALSRELARLHHGEIHVSSEEGVGSIFTIRLPLGRLHLHDDEIKSIPETKMVDLNYHSDSHQVKAVVQTPSVDADIPLLLIVEDNNDMRTYIREVLSGSYRIKEAADGEAGFTRASELIPDLIISDVMMPTMNGYQLCGKIKTDERTSHIPVILLTAKSGKESKMEGLEQGADDYLIKPFESDELKVRIKNLIQQRISLKARFKDEVLFGSNPVEKTSLDQAFILRAASVLDKHLHDPELDINRFAREIGLSRSQLHRKLQGTLNQSASEFIRSLRLKKAAAMLSAQAESVSEIAFLVGFKNNSYFSKCFKEQFGMSPSEYSK